jgi:tyrosinase
MQPRPVAVLQTGMGTQALTQRELSSQQQNSFLQAVVCLHNSPSRMNIGSPSRYDDIAYVHYKNIQAGHSGSWFLPWHRIYMAAFEYILKTECGYQGALPYWDWSVDWQSLPRATVWSANAFGGSGDPRNGQCINNGYFSRYQCHFAHDGCVKRQLGNGAYSVDAVNRLIMTSGRSYSQFEQAFEYGAHASIHNAVGGTMVYLDISANGTLS